MAHHQQAKALDQEVENSNAPVWGLMARAAHPIPIDVGVKLDLPVELGMVRMGTTLLCDGIGLDSLGARMLGHMLLDAADELDKTGWKPARPASTRARRRPDPEAAEQKSDAR